MVMPLGCSHEGPGTWLRMEGQTMAACRGAGPVQAMNRTLIERGCISTASVKGGRKHALTLVPLTRLAGTINQYLIP